MTFPAPKLPGGPYVMAVLNVTPDSFSDGGRHASADAAVEAGLRLLDQGADMIDVGGESTRPGAAPASATEELARVLPTIEGLRRRTDAPISIDTMKPEVARAAIAAGAGVWNDVNALRAPGALESAAELGCGVVLMHMQGEPRTMQADPQYGDVVGEVTAFLEERVESAIAAGAARERIWVDPGIGFGKTLAHNLALLGALRRIREAVGMPLLLGVSRKSFIRAIDKTAVDPLDRVGGSLAAALAGARGGADILRVHDVRETVQALLVERTIVGLG